MTDTEIAALLLRAVLGATMLAHGYNHLFGAGGVAGTARWFASIGLRPPKVHAWTSGLLECGVGLALLAGLLTPLSCAAVIGVMAVAGVVAHRPNGFFVFRDGYEYVLFVSVAAAALSAIGPGRLALDHVVPSLPEGGWGVLIAVGAAVTGTAVMLSLSWRPTGEEAA
ncbi:DoxX family protein [Jatrophihabitans cynanchi]|uniref:DoxX family protein n=1 Tax=Jatrophihabitans cynanchi TaxID=2944128 RepID=A0ABY7K7B6_9ACTN|nr:DoxX family protein [Jatrophihabitans sp. SB3-54]WAX59016.1 DoxX family protein [Jatrophihabitans sp. SB3-54]